jgi:hypothetical protein
MAPGTVRGKGFLDSFMPGTGLINAAAQIEQPGRFCFLFGVALAFHVAVPLVVMAGALVVTLCLVMTGTLATAMSFSLMCGSVMSVRGRDSRAIDSESDSRSRKGGT